MVCTEIYIAETATDAFSHTLTLGVYALHCTGLSTAACHNYGLLVSAYLTLEQIILTHRDVCQMLKGNTGWLTFIAALIYHSSGGSAYLETIRINVALINLFVYWIRVYNDLQMM